MIMAEVMPVVWSCATEGGRQSDLTGLLESTYYD